MEGVDLVQKSVVDMVGAGMADSVDLLHVEDQMEEWQVVALEVPGLPSREVCAALLGATVLPSSPVDSTKWRD